MQQTPVRVEIIRESVKTPKQMFKQMSREEAIQLHRLNRACTTGLHLMAGMAPGWQVFQRGHFECAGPRQNRCTGMEPSWKGFLPSVHPH